MIEVEPFVNIFFFKTQFPMSEHGTLYMLVYDLKMVWILLSCHY